MYNGEIEYDEYLNEICVLLDNINSNLEILVDRINKNTTTSDF